MRDVLLIGNGGYTDALAVALMAQGYTHIDANAPMLGMLTVTRGKHNPIEAMEFLINHLLPARRLWNKAKHDDYQQELNDAYQDAHPLLRLSGVANMAKPFKQAGLPVVVTGLSYAYEWKACAGDLSLAHLMNDANSDQSPLVKVLEETPLRCCVVGIGGEYPAAEHTLEELTPEAFIGLLGYLEGHATPA